jgi:hypothetical protein
MAQAAEDDMRAIFGTFDPDLKNDAVESGKAILARQDQSYNSNYHIFANVRHSIAHTGRIIVEALPVIMDTARDEQVMGVDGKKRKIAFNQPNEHGVVEYDLTSGNYSVSIQTGPSFGTKRQEMAEATMDLIAAYPACAPAIVDIAVRSQDWEGAQEMADSLEALVPPQVLAARRTDVKKAAALIPQLQAQLNAAQQHIQQLTAEHTAMAAKLNDKSIDLQIEVMKSKDDERKATLEHDIKIRNLKQQEEVAILEFKIREAELELDRQKLELATKEANVKAEVAIVETLADLNDSHHDRAVEHVTRMSMPAGPDLPGTEDEGGAPGLHEAL